MLEVLTSAVAALRVLVCCVAHRTADRNATDAARDRHALRDELRRAVEAAAKATQELLASERQRMEEEEAERQRRAQEEEARRAADENDSVTAERLFRQQVRATVAQHTEQLTGLGKEVKSVKFLAERKADAAYVDAAVAEGVKDRAKKVDCDVKADKDDLDALSGMLQARIQEVADNQAATQAIAAIRRDMEARVRVPPPLQQRWPTPLTPPRCADCRQSGQRNGQPALPSHGGQPGRVRLAAGLRGAREHAAAADEHQGAEGGRRRGAVDAVKAAGGHRGRLRDGAGHEGRTREAEVYVAAR